ncbi:uncharacterized protein LOC118733952 [Rhagoletis pomonella]|uniref:uncharacterized protein LOC118733952 n=1 Tax=Rhagoletis pomonella TaxID=28610 RepID=UPI001784BE56|nr:uncharacterized protein LOC118733952 [Rhagoletis pomonella]
MDTNTVAGCTANLLAGTTTTTKPTTPCTANVSVAANSSLVAPVIVNNMSSAGLPPVSQHIPTGGVSAESDAVNATAAEVPNPPSPTRSPVWLTAENQQSQLVEQQQQQLQTHQCAFNDTSTIADIIDASALEAVTGEAIFSADIASTSQQQPHNQQQQQRSQDQEQQPESLSGAQCSSLSVIGEVPAGGSALTERKKISPTSLPLLLQEEEDEEADTGNEARASKSPAAVAASAATAAVALTSTTILVLLVSCIV